MLLFAERSRLPVCSKLNLEVSGFELGRFNRDLGQGNNHGRTFTEPHGSQRPLFPALGNLARTPACPLCLRDLRLGSILVKLCPLGN